MLIISGLFFCFNIYCGKNIGVTIGARDILSDQKLKETVKSLRLVYFFSCHLEISSDSLLHRMFLFYQKMQFEHEPSLFRKGTNGLMTNEWCSASLDVIVQRSPNLGLILPCSVLTSQLNSFGGGDE